jgi:hypothetical protein
MVRWRWVTSLPGRSDLDVLAVMATDPTTATLAVLNDVYARLDADFPEWSGHVEVDYISVEAVKAVVQGTDESHPMIRISPGEPLHVVEASRHYVLNWAAAIQADQPIAGAAPSTVLPVRQNRQVTVPGMVRAHRLGPGLVVPRRIGLRSGPVRGCTPICRGGQRAFLTALRHLARPRPGMSRVSVI